MLQFLLNDERVKLGLDEIANTSLRTYLPCRSTRLVDYNLVKGERRRSSYTVDSWSQLQSRPIAIGLGNFYINVLFEDGSEQTDYYGTRSKIAPLDAVNKYLT
jgi:hypothetical protein